MNDDIEITVHSEGAKEKPARPKEKAVVIEECPDHRYTDSNISDQIADAITNGNYNEDGSRRYDFSQNPVFGEMQGQKLNKFIDSHNGEKVLFSTNVAADAEENMEAIKYFHKVYDIAVVEVSHHDCGGVGMKCACEQGMVYDKNSEPISRQMAHLDGLPGDRTQKEAQNATFQIAKIRRNLADGGELEMLPLTADFSGYRKVEDPANKVLLIATSDDISRSELCKIAEVDRATKGVYVLRTHLTEDPKSLEGILSSTACSIVGLHIRDIRLVPTSQERKSMMDKLKPELEKLGAVAEHGANVSVPNFYRDTGGVSLRKEERTGAPKKVKA